MDQPGQNSWLQLLDVAAETFKVLARNKMRGGTGLSTEQWYDLAADTAERVTPRRDVALIALMRARPALLSRPLDDDARSLAEAAYTLFRDALRDELSGRLNSLRADLMHAPKVIVAAEAHQQLKEFVQTNADWELFAPRVEEVFMLQMEEDFQRGVLPELGRDPRRVIAYIGAFARESLPEGADEILSLIASAPPILVREPAPGQTFEACATLTLEEAVGEHLVDRFKLFWERQWAAAA
jgi:hypothetical protein